MRETPTSEREPQHQEQQPGDMAEQVRALPYVKELILPDRARLDGIKNRIAQLAQAHSGDAKFQQNVVGYLNETVKFLELPMIIDTFGDRPEDHDARRIEIRKLGRENPLYKYLETQKLSGGNVLGGVLTIFAERYMPLLYRPSNEQDELERIAEDAADLRIEVTDKFAGTVTTPLEEKVQMVRRVEDFVELSIGTFIEAYASASEGARAYRQVRDLRQGDKVRIDDRIVRVVDIGREPNAAGPKSARMWVSFDDSLVQWYSDPKENVEIPAE